MKQKQSLSHSLSITPSLQQAIKLLQLSTIELKEELEQALESNPLLENDETVQVEATWEDIYSDPIPVSVNKNADAPNFEAFVAEQTSLRDHLYWQLELSTFTETDAEIAKVIIDSIDDDGFLTISTDEIISTVEGPKVEADEVEAVVHRIQGFEPAGVAARDLKESLWLQLKELPCDTPFRKEAVQIVKHYLDELGAHDFAKIIKKENFLEESFHEALHLIQSLDPKPGRQIGQRVSEYIIPDVIVKKDNNIWKVELNTASLPRLRINPNYAALIKRADNSVDNTFLKDNLAEAKTLINSLKTRNNTLLNVAKTIVTRQVDFFEHGEEAMKPMVLQNVATELDMHESTISRVTSSKYMLTPKGVYDLRFFFSSHVKTQGGEACSSTAIRALIKKLVGTEDATAPLSDNAIAQFLENQGINIARRTVAKYREALHIPPSHERKLKE